MKFAPATIRQKIKKNLIGKHFDLLSPELPATKDVFWGSTSEQTKQLITELLARLCLSNSAQKMLSEMLDDGWKIALEDLNLHDYHLDVPEKKIVLDTQGMSINALANSRYFRQAMLLALARAARDVWQERRHGAFEERYAPEDVLMLERVRTADCNVMAILVAWEIREAGVQDLWKHIIASEEGDMAMGFMRYIERDVYNRGLQGAMRAAFKLWFTNEALVTACDHETLEYLDCILQESEEAQPFGKATLSAPYIEILSCLPDKTAYLRGMGGEILCSPLYAGLHDELNQTHLLQILHDMDVLYVQGVPFRDHDLAQKIFPGGKFTPETESLQRTS